MAGRPPGSPNKTKPYRDALHMVLADINEGRETKYPKGSLRSIAYRNLLRAEEETVAAKEVADRVDGKVAQTIAGDDEEAPIRVQGVEWILKGPGGTEGN